MPPEKDPLEAFDLDAQEPDAGGSGAQEPIVIDLDEAVFEVLQRVDVSGDPSAWIRAAVREKAQRDRRSDDVTERLYELLDEMKRIVALEQEFAEAAAVDPLHELTARLREAEAVIDKLDSILEHRRPDDAEEEF